MPLLTNPGRHAATVTALEFGESNNGTPFLRLDFNTAEGSIAGWLYLSDKALPGTVRTLRQAFDFNGDFETAKEQVTGKECSIVVENESYEGKDRLKVKWVNSAKSPVKPISGGESFLKALSAKAARVPTEAPKTAKPAAAPAKPAPKPAAKPSSNEPF